MGRAHSIRRVAAVAFCAATLAAGTARALDNMAMDPYRGAIVMNADTGEVLFEDHADRVGYPASMVKLMSLLLVVEALEREDVSLSQQVKITRETEEIGGRQVWLATGESFALEELLYAMMIHSANDAATAVAIHMAGSKEAWAGRMTARARQLGMTRTSIHNVHGLPPGRDQKPDVSTARDMALLAREAAGHDRVFPFTSTRSRPFREGSQTVTLATPNPLLASVEGCDGFKTGYFRAAGFSIIATARRADTRIIAVVLGARSQTTRNRKAAELLELGFRNAARPAQ